MISGQPGSSKSQLALDLLAQLTNHGFRFVFFDM
jgi:nucleoside-triphosphatase THEP1